MPEYEWPTAYQRYQYKFKFASSAIAQAVFIKLYYITHEEGFKRKFRYTPPLQIAPPTSSSDIIIKATNEQKHELAKMAKRHLREIDASTKFNIAVSRKPIKDDEDNRRYYHILESDGRAKLPDTPEEVVRNINMFIEETLFQPEIFDKEINLLGAGAIIDLDGELWVYATSWQMATIAQFSEIRGTLVEESDMIDCPD